MSLRTLSRNREAVERRARGTTSGLFTALFPQQAQALEICGLYCKLADRYCWRN